MSTDLSVVFYISYVVVWVLVILQSLVLLGVVRIVYQLQRDTSVNINAVALKTGQIAPEINATDLSGAPVNSLDYKDRLVALLFVSPNCQSCTATLYEMQALNYKTQGNVLVICRAGHEDCARLAEMHQLNTQVIADEDSHITRRFGVSSFPTAVLIAPGNRIKSFGQPDRGGLEEILKEEPQEELESVSIRR